MMPLLDNIRFLTTQQQISGEDIVGEIEDTDIIWEPEDDNPSIVTRDSTKCSRCKL